MPGNEEDVRVVPENTLTVDILAEGFQLFMIAFGFCDMDPSMIQALKLKQTVQEGWALYRNILRKMKKQKRSGKFLIYFRKIMPGVPASPASPAASATPETRPTPPPQPTQREGLYDGPLPLNNSK